MSQYRLYQPLFSEGNLLQSASGSVAKAAQNIVALCEAYGSHGLYSEEALNDGLGEGLPQRFDAAFNHIKSGGRKGQPEDMDTAIKRSNYFRETYAYGADIRAPGIEHFLNYQGFVEGARELFGKPVIVPAIVFANLMLPGQEIGVHTDVPEFRGASRKELPQWLLVVMHHSGLFEEWRMPIATAVSWYHNCDGGEFAFWPQGIDAEPVAIPAKFNTAIITDTDSVFHGVDRVAASQRELPDLRPGMKLHPLGQGHWQLRENADVIADYDWNELRFSVSWKAYCFADDDEKARWQRGEETLTKDCIVDILKGELRRRGRLRGDETMTDLAITLVDEFVKFPAVS